MDQKSYALSHSNVPKQVQIDQKSYVLSHSNVSKQVQMDQKSYAYSNVPKQIQMVQKSYALSHSNVPKHVQMGQKSYALSHSNVPKAHPNGPKAYGFWSCLIVKLACLSIPFFDVRRLAIPTFLPSTGRRTQTRFLSVNALKEIMLFKNNFQTIFQKKCLRF